MLQLSQSLLRIWLLETTLSNFFLLSSHTAFYTTAVRIQHQFSLVAHSWPHGLQHARPPCPSPTPRVYSNSSPLSRWCHLTISSSVVPSFSSRLQSFPASGSLPVSQFFTSGGQSFGVLASASVLPMNIQDCFTLQGTNFLPGLFVTRFHIVLAKRKGQLLSPISSLSVSLLPLFRLSDLCLDCVYSLLSGFPSISFFLL